MNKIDCVLFFKAHVDGYTKKDGTFVKPHDDSRDAAETRKTGDRVVSSSGSEKNKPKEKDWRDEENWHSRTMGRMKTLTEEQLQYVMKDANEAAEAMEKMGSNSKKSGQYRDEAHYAGMELTKRRKAAKGGK